MKLFWLFRRPAGRRHFSGLCQWLCHENRSKDRLVQCFGMEKKHLLVMTLWELLIFYILTAGAGLGLGPYLIP